MAFEYNGVVYRDLEPQVRYDAEQIQILKQEVKKTNASNLENGTGKNSLQQKYIKDGVDYSAQATGENSAAFGGLRYDYDPEKHSGDKTNTAAGGQSFVTGCGNYTAGDWSFVTGKDNTVYSNRAFVSGGANVSQAVDSVGNLLEAKTNIGRFNAIFGNNNTFKSSDTSKESNLIAGGSNTADTERSVIVGYNNNVAGHYDAVFGLKNVVNADYSLTGGQNNIVSGGSHLVAGSGNKVSGQFNIASGQDNKNLGWNGAVIGRELIVGEGHTAQTVLGQYNDNKSNTVLEIGWGSSDNRKNVFEVLQDGRAKVKAAPIQDDDVVRKGDLTNIGGGGKLYRHNMYFFSGPSEGFRITVYTSKVKKYTPETFFEDLKNSNLYSCGTISTGGKTYPICDVLISIATKRINYITSDGSQAYKDINPSNLQGSDTVYEV